MPKVKPGSKRRILKGWEEIAEFLGQTVSVAQRWQKSGMPVTREGRSVYAFSEALTAWVGTERGKKEPVHIATEGERLACGSQAGPFLRSPKAKDSEVLRRTACSNLPAKCRILRLCFSAGPPNSNSGTTSYQPHSGIKSAVPALQARSGDSCPPPLQSFFGW